jgi:hypothetical protein
MAVLQRELERNSESCGSDGGTTAAVPARKDRHSSGPGSHSGEAKQNARLDTA